MKAVTVRLATSVLVGVGILAGALLTPAPASAAVVRRTTTITTYRTRRPGSWSRSYNRYSRHNRRGARRHARRYLRTHRPFGDRDRDGVPNAVDRRPMNPNR